MAPLSYYWIISFMYLVINKDLILCQKIREFAGMEYLDNISPEFVFSDVSTIFFVRNTSYNEAKKRYVYMVQSGIMNYKG
jgi:hypothetical protein